MTTGSVLYQQHGGIVTLTMNRPESLNAMNEAMMGEIERVLIELEDRHRDASSDPHRRRTSVLVRR